MTLYMINFTTESGDRLQGGYWKQNPTYEDVMSALRESVPDEAQYIEQLIEYGAWSKNFWDVTEINTDAGHPTVWY